MTEALKESHPEPVQDALDAVKPDSPDKTDKGKQP